MIKARNLLLPLAFALVFLQSGCYFYVLDSDRDDAAERLRNDIHHCGQAAHRNKHFDDAVEVYTSEHGRTPTIPASALLANLIRDKHLACLRDNISANFRYRNVVAEGVMQQEDSGRVLWIMTGNVTVSDMDAAFSGPASSTESIVTDVLIPPRSTSFTFTRRYQ